MRLLEKKDNVKNKRKERERELKKKMSKFIYLIIRIKRK